jgi:hypothetical protein
MHQECPQNALSEPAATKSAGNVRIVGAWVALPCLAVLLTAVFLTPDPRGVGTHTQLGLPSCSMISWTGYPCPSCGLTTAVTAAVHLDWGASLRAQPFGLPLAAVLLLLGGAGTWQLVTGTDALGRLRFSAWWLAYAMAGMFLGWGAKLAAGVWSGTLPVH